MAHQRQGRLFRTRRGNWNRVHQAPRARRLAFEALECRFVLSAAAHDLIGLTALRNDAQLNFIDGRLQSSTGTTQLAVAVIDTGVDGSHPQLSGNYLTGLNFVPGTPNWVADHGSHVAGIVGSTNPDVGVATGAGLIGLQVFTPQPGGQPNADLRDTEQALQWVLQNYQEYNIVAVNMSLGGGFFSSQEQVASVLYADEIVDLERVGVTVVAAAGNSYGQSIIRQLSQGIQPQNLDLNQSAFPGIFSALNVGAVWETDEGGPIGPGADPTIYETTGGDRVVGFSQRPPQQVGNAIFAPGALINSTIPGGGFAEFAGTSMASPMVAGTVALVQEAALTFGGRFLLPNEVRSVLLQTADLIVDGDDEDDRLWIDANNNGSPQGNELLPLPYTNQTYRRLNVYDAVRFVRDAFEDTGGTTNDVNGTLDTAIPGPTLTGAAVAPLLESIGLDGPTINVGGSDVDIFRFDVVVPGTVTVETASHPNSPDDFDSMLRLFNSQGTEIAFDDDEGEGTFSRISMQLSAGTYFAGVSGYNNRNYNPNQAASGTAAETGNYAIQFSLGGGSDVNGIIAGAVPVNLSSNIDPQTLNGIIGFDFGQAVSNLDVDIFEVHVPDSGVLFIDVDTPFDTDFVDSFVRVFNAQGQQLAFSDDDDAPWEEEDPFSDLVFDDLFESFGHDLDSFVPLEVERGDVIYVAVSAFGNSLYNPNSLAGRQPDPGRNPVGGLYDLTVTFINNDSNGSIQQAVDDSFAPLPSSNIGGLIGFDFGVEVGDRDVDFVKINSPTAGILEIDINSFSLSTIPDGLLPVDATLTLFDDEGNRLGFMDDFDGLDPMLQIDLAANTNVYAAIAGYGNHTFNPFLLGSGSPGDTGYYEFNSRLLPSSAESQLADDRASYSGVRTIEAGASISDFVGRDGAFIRGEADVDLYRFVPAATGRYEISAAGLDEFGTDPFLRIFNNSGTELAFNDDASSSTLDSLIGIDLTVGQTYLVGVNGYSPQARNYNPISGAGAAPGTQGDYLLEIESLSTTLDGDYNANGTVDAADYVLWRRGNGDQNGYNTWRRNYGSSAGGGAAQTAAVDAEQSALGAAKAVAWLSHFAPRTELPRSQGHSGISRDELAALGASIGFASHGSKAAVDEQALASFRNSPDHSSNRQLTSGRTGVTRVDAIGQTVRPLDEALLALLVSEQDQNGSLAHVEADTLAAVDAEGNTRLPDVAVDRAFALLLSLNDLPRLGS